MFGSGDLRERRGSEAHRARRRRNAPGRVCKHPSRRGHFHLSLEGKGEIRAGTATAHQDGAKTPREIASSRGAASLLRCARIYRAAHCRRIARLPILDGRGFVGRASACPVLTFLTHQKPDRLKPVLRERKSDFPERLIEVVNQIFHVLNSDGDANQPVGDSDPLAHFGWDRGVRHGRGMRDERFHSS
jgi:hypothetical protein